MLYFRLDPLCTLWFLHIATFSMLPLLAIDQLIYPTIILTFIYLMLIRVAIRWSINDKISTSSLLLWDPLSLSNICDNKLYIGIFYVSTFIGCSLLVVGQVFVRPPNSLPFLFSLLISAYSCVHFVLFFIYFNIRQIFGGAIVKIDTIQRVTRKTSNKTVYKKTI